MNKCAIYHRPESSYCFAVDSKTVGLRIRFEKGEKLRSVSVLFNTKYEIATKQYKEKMHFACSDGTFDYYAATLHLKDSRLAYVFEIVSDKTQYFCESGLKDSYDFPVAYYDSFQFAFLNAGDIIQNIEWLNSAVFYQIFVDRFDKASQKDESYITGKWGELPTPKSFFGGDLDGIRNRLDYIKSLGVNALYLTPIFKSVSNHKYDTIDYYTVDEMFGGNDALKRLVASCHQKGIRVVLDAVFNHVSDRFAPFSDVLQKGKSSRYFDWFMIDGDTVSSERNNYCCFASCKDMPKLNTNNTELQSYLSDVAEYWIKNYDIDGWRLDVADEVSHDFWRVMRRRVKAAKYDAVLIGENWHNSESYLNGDQFDGIMNYSLTKAMTDFWADDILDEVGLADTLNGLLMRYGDTTNKMMFNLLDCHDTHRFYSLVKCNPDKLICALATLAFLPGSVNLYYGTEILTEGGYDPDSRRCFDFSRLNDPKITFYTKKIAEILKLKTQPAIKNGETEICAKDGFFVVVRKTAEQTLTLKISQNRRPVSGKYVFCHNVVGNQMTQNSFVIEGELL